jgi:hypothetical protein
MENERPLGHLALRALAFGVGDLGEAAAEVHAARAPAVGVGPGDVAPHREVETLNAEEPWR